MNASTTAPRTEVVASQKEGRLLRLLQGTWLDTAFVPAVVLALFVYLSLSADFFFTKANLNNVLSQAVILAVVAFGMTFVIICREIDLSVGAGVAFVSVVTAKTMVATNSMTLGLVVGVVTGVAIGAVNGLIVTLLEVPSFIATLGMLVILRGAGLAITNGGVVAGLPTEFINAAETTVLSLPYIVWMMFIVFTVLLVVERQTTFGVRVYAVGGNPSAARLTGIRTRLVTFVCFLVSGVTIGLAGIALTARVESGQPNGANLLELYAIAAVVMGGTSLFGGRGTIVRTLFGVLLIVVLQNGLDLKSVNFDLQQAIIGVVFIAAASVDFFRRRLAARASRASVRRRLTMVATAQPGEEGEAGGGGT